MADLSARQVAALAEALGLPIAQEDLREVTFRLNALQEALASLEEPDLDSVEPLPVFWLAEEGPRGG
ncbi:MAG: hypothetical protein HY535_02160 [Chloroflexi bacterium]|nr:hypothetical protein [Chloroflexota bacterium]